MRAPGEGRGGVRGRERERERERDRTGPDRPEQRLRRPMTSENSGSLQQTEEVESSPVIRENESRTAEAGKDRGGMVSLGLCVLNRHYRPTTNPLSPLSHPCRWECGDMRVAR